MSGSGFVSRSQLCVGVSLARHADFCSSESFPEFQMAQFPSGQQAESSGIAHVSPNCRAPTARPLGSQS